MSHMYLSHVPSIVTDRKHISYISCLASCCCGTNFSAQKVRSSFSSVFAHQSKKKSQGASAQFSWLLRDELYDQIGGGFEESACCLQETVLIMAVWKEEGGGREEGGGEGMDQAGQ